jgi:hypothetical protein
MILLFACRRYRLRDMGLIKLGATAAGHRFVTVILPFAAPLLLAAAVLRLAGVRMHLVISDKLPGDGLLAKLFGTRCTRILWNYSDEWPAVVLKAPRHKVCFFEEEGQQADLFVFAPQPDKIPRIPRGPRREIVFVGDVTVDLEVARGVAWWRERFETLRDSHGYGFYLCAEYETLLARELPDVQHRRMVRVLAKNLLRLWIVQSVHERFAGRLKLVGSNWRRLQIPSEPSVYSNQVRFGYYQSATINLDCGSKSGGSSLYPRSSELITMAGGLLQVECADSSRVFGDRSAEFCFRDEAMLAAAIEKRLAEPERLRDERDAWLAEHLRRRGLLMEDSIERMLEQAQRMRG